MNANLTIPESKHHLKFIDLRSDTVSHPTPEMRQAMLEAEVGDDVYGDDPTVNKLESLAAEMLGKEAAMFVPSGTMANVSAAMVHLRRGEEAIVGMNSHMYLNEQAALAALCQAQAVPIVESPDGTLPLEALEAAVRAPDEHHPESRLVAIENTQNIRGGKPLSVAYTQAVGEFAKRHGLKFHIDGARLFNAAVALNVSAAQLTRPADSVSFCLSKGLCAPVGSMLCGDAEFIKRARRARKVLGGSMRQAGVIAAAGIVALGTMIERLITDHENAARLARGLAKVPGIVLNPADVQTNMVYFDLLPEVSLTAGQVAERLVERGVLVGPVGAKRFRAVTHYWVSAEAVDKAVSAFEDVLAQARPSIG